MRDVQGSTHCLCAVNKNALIVNVTITSVGACSVCSFFSDLNALKIL